MNITAQRSPRSDTVYAIDLAKNMLEVHTFGPQGACRKMDRLSRKKFVAKFTNPHTERGVVVMEACRSSHHWGRQLRSHGYRTQLVPPQFVAQRRVGNKNDGNDADAIYAVYRDPRIRPVPVNTLAQQDLAALHRTRELLVVQRTQCINQIRGLLAERGVVERAGTGGLQALMKRINQEDLPEVTTSLQHQVALIHAHVGEIDAHLKVLECELDSAYQGSVVAQPVTRDVAFMEAHDLGLHDFDEACLLHWRRLLRCALPHSRSRPSPFIPVRTTAATRRWHQAHVPRFASAWSFICRDIGFNRQTARPIVAAPSRRLTAGYAP